MFLLSSAGVFFADTIKGRAVLTLRRLRYGRVSAWLRIELRFAHTLPLPSPGNRPVSVL